jgi:hypothetical protein
VLIIYDYLPQDYSSPKTKLKMQFVKISFFDIFIKMTKAEFATLKHQAEYEKNHDAEYQLGL